MQSASPNPCPCCGGPNWLFRWKGFVQCRDCGLMAVDQRFSPEQLKALYQESYFKGDEYIDYQADKPAQLKTLGRHLRLVQRHIPRGSRILEIGCAYGFFLELAQKDYPGSVGVDVSSAGVAHARAQGLDVREGDLLTVQLERQFDAVCLWDTIEHLPQPAEVVERLVGLLQSGGHLFLTTGDFGALVPRLQGLRWRQIHPPTHLFYFTRRSLKELCGRVGLEVVQFGTATVYRRIGSALQSLARFHTKSLAGRAAAAVLRHAPLKLLGWTIPLNLGDTLYLVARKK